MKQLALVLAWIACAQAWAADSLPLDAAGELRASATAAALPAGAPSALARIVRAAPALAAALAGAATATPPALVYRGAVYMPITFRGRTVLGSLPLSGLASAATGLAPGAQLQDAAAVRRRAQADPAFAAALAGAPAVCRALGLDPASLPAPAAPPATPSPAQLALARDLLLARVLLGSGAIRAVRHAGAVDVVETSSTRGLALDPARPDQPVEVDASTLPPAAPSATTTSTVPLAGSAPPAGAGVPLGEPPPASSCAVTVVLPGAGASSDADAALVRRFADQHGLAVGAVDLACHTVQLSGPIDVVAAAFEVGVEAVYQDGALCHANTGPLRVPRWLAGHVVAVLGLDTRPLARPHVVYPRDTPPIDGPQFTSDQLARLYAFPGDADGTGQTIAIIEFGGGFQKSDLDAYCALLGIPTPAVAEVGVDGAKNAFDTDSDSSNDEVNLDLQVAAGAAKGASLVVYYAPNNARGFFDAINAAVHDTDHHPSVISLSWGSREGATSATFRAALERAIADAKSQHVTICAAAGDYGAWDLGPGVQGPLDVEYPASSPGVLAVGGTHLEASASAITSEAVWFDGTSGTGGGVSTVFAVPDWQAHAGVPPTADAAKHVGRGVPDVAAVADPSTGYQIIERGQNYVVGGTSGAAPLWASLIARLNQKRGAPVGFVNDRLYAAPAGFRDIVDGTNGAYHAGPGWDACSGLGSPSGDALLRALGP